MKSDDAGVSYTIDKQDLSEHKKSKHKFVFCKLCNFQTTSTSRLNAHKESMHEGMQSCNKCAYQAKGKNDLINHRKSKHEDVLHSCNQCSYQASLRNNLKKHILNSHGGFRFICSSNLSKHKQSKHEGPRYHCVYCDYIASRKDHLYRHNQRHHSPVHLSV